MILFSHSMSGHFGWKLLELRPRRIAAVVGVAPGSWVAARAFPRELVPAYARTLHPVPPRLLFERVNANESVLRFDDLAVLAGKPIVIVSATHDIDHPRAFEAGMVDWLNAHGARATHLHLGDRGIVGNGHMMMLETNSSEIADAIAGALATAS